MELLKNGGTPAGDSPTEPASPRGAKSIHAEISLVSTRDRDCGVQAIGSD